ncbi:MAG: hypothetical protein ACRCZD_02070, partial [Phycicoccus sp.]
MTALPLSDAADHETANTTDPRDRAVSTAENPPGAPGGLADGGADGGTRVGGGPPDLGVVTVRAVESSVRLPEKLARTVIVTVLPLGKPVTAADL